MSSNIYDIQIENIRKRMYITGIGALSELALSVTCIMIGSIIGFVITIVFALLLGFYSYATYKDLQDTKELRDILNDCEYVMDCIADCNRTVSELDRK